VLEAVGGYLVDVRPLLLLALLEGLTMHTDISPVREQPFIESDVEQSARIAQIHAHYSNSEHEFGAFVEGEIVERGIFHVVDRVFGDDVGLGRYFNRIPDEDGPEHYDNDQAEEPASEGAVAVLAFIAEQLRRTEKVYFPKEKLDST
jgi:hypothetical protein